MKDLSLNTVAPQTPGQTGSHAPDQVAPQGTTYFHPHMSGARLITSDHDAAEDGGWVPVDCMCDECGGTGLAIEGCDCEECDGLGYWDV